MTLTLRHYDAIGLLKPVGTSMNGYRSYADAELLRLQQILAFKELGLALADIGAILDSSVDPESDEAQANAEYLLGLGELYVADERFAANYGGKHGAEFVSTTLRHYVDASIRSDQG